MSFVTPDRGDGFRRLEHVLLLGRRRRQVAPAVFLMSQKPAFPRGLFNAHEKMRFDAVNGLYF